jgi:hypothetical protein
MKAIAWSVVLFCAVCGRAQCNTTITAATTQGEIRKAMSCLAAENSRLRAQLKSARPAQEFSEILSQFPVAPSPSPYTYASYNTDLQALADLLRDFVAYFQANPSSQVSVADNAAFFSSVVTRVDIARVRACGFFPHDQYYWVHCMDNFAHFEAIVDKLEIDIGSSIRHDNRLPLDKVQSYQDDIPHWLNCAVIRGIGETQQASLPACQVGGPSSQIHP